MPYKGYKDKQHRKEYEKIYMRAYRRQHQGELTQLRQQLHDIRSLYGLTIEYQII